jgi:hypothetical protein
MEIVINYFDENSELISSIISSYEKLKELREKYELIKNYAYYIQKSFNTSVKFDNLYYIDSYGIEFKLLVQTIDNLDNKIVHEENFLNENENFVYSFTKFSILKGIQDNCVKFEFSKFYCKLCDGRLSCSNPSKWSDQRFFGEIYRIENGILIFTNGSSCKNYNKNYVSKVILECGEIEKIVFKERKNGCEYVFVYYTKIGCNGLALRNMQKRIKLYIGD